MPETQARLRYVRISPTKARPVLALIRGQDIMTARDTLRLSDRAVSREIAKLLESAVANAEHNNHVLEDELFVARAFADGFDCVVLENHGVVTGGASLAHAFQRFETLEFAARRRKLALASIDDDQIWQTDGGQFRILSTSLRFAQDKFADFGLPFGHELRAERRKGVRSHALGNFLCSFLRKL